MLLDDLMALYEAVLIDIGGIEDNDYLYPEDRIPETYIDDEASRAFGVATSDKKS